MLRSESIRRQLPNLKNAPIPWNNVQTNQFMLLFKRIILLTSGLQPQRRWKGWYFRASREVFFHVQLLCAWPADGCPVGPGPRVNISIFNHSLSRSPTAPTRSSSKSRCSMSDRWKMCFPQTECGTNAPSEARGFGTKARCYYRLRFDL